MPKLSEHAAEYKRMKSNLRNIEKHKQGDTPAASQVRDMLQILRSWLTAEEIEALDKE